MRTFYIFKIKKPYVILTRHNPFNLYKTIEHISNVKTDELKIATNLFNQISGTFNKDQINKLIFKKYQNAYSYTNHVNTHTIYDYHTKEQTKLIIYRSFIIIQSTKQIPSFLKTIATNNNLFICDFNNKDYFWLDQAFN